METVYSGNRGPKAKRGRTRIRMGEVALGEYRGSTLIQIIAILIALGLLSVLAIPRYIETQKDRQREAEEAEARGYLRNLHRALTANTANHYLRGTQWVENGEDLMALLGEGWPMPKGMQYADNVWTDEKVDLKWEFDRSSGLLPPQVRRIEQRAPPEALEMEPIGRNRSSNNGSEEPPFQPFLR